MMIDRKQCRIRYRSTPLGVRYARTLRYEYLLRDMRSAFQEKIELARLQRLTRICDDRP